MHRKITGEMVECFRTTLLNEEKSSATIKKYIRDVQKFLNFAACGEVTKETVISYKLYLVENFSPNSVNSMLASVNRFLKEMGLHDCTVKALKLQRQSFRQADRELSKSEYFRLLETAKRRKNKRLYLLMQTICSTGIRVGELRCINTEAVNRGYATVSLKGKVRQVIIPKPLQRALKNYIKDKKIKEGSIFVTRNGKPLDRSNILHEMKSLCSEAGVDRSKVFPHNLRHLFACMYYKLEKDLSRLADILGHSNINTTRIYTSVSRDVQQRAIDKLGLVAGSW